MQAVLDYLTPSMIAEEVSRFTYRPGWKLTTYMHPWEGIHLYIVADVVDSNDDSQLTQLRISSPIPPMPTVEYLGYWLAWRLARIEIHEALEFLRYDGERVVDPHKIIEPLVVTG